MPIGGRRRTDAPSANPAENSETRNSSQIDHCQDGDNRVERRHNL